MEILVYTVNRLSDVSGILNPKKAEEINSIADLIEKKWSLLKLDWITFSCLFFNSCEEFFSTFRDREDDFDA